MTERPLRLETAPELVIKYPECSACEIDLEPKPCAGWICPNCWTTWSDDAHDGDVGDLTDFSFTDDDLVCPNYEAWRLIDRPPEDRDRVIRLAIERGDAVRRMNEARK